MIYKGFDIYYIQPLMEKQGIDENGNPVYFRDCWQSSGGWYQADREHPPKRIRVKSGLARMKLLIDREEK